MSFLHLIRSAGVPNGAADRRTSSRFRGGTVERLRGGGHRKSLGGHIDFKNDRRGVQEPGIAATATVVAADRRRGWRRDAGGHLGAAGTFERWDDAI